MTIIRMLLALSLSVPGANAGAVSLAPPGIAACSNCHPKSGGDAVLKPLAGRDAADTVAAMVAFRNGTRPATVMGRIAKGFSDDEITAIAAWYAAQR
jgi:cytochrome subunit of sulfide dehydrogenase